MTRKFPCDIDTMIPPPRRLYDDRRVMFDKGAASVQGENRRATRIRERFFVPNTDAAPGLCLTNPVQPSFPPAHDGVGRLL